MTTKKTNPVKKTPLRERAEAQAAKSETDLKNIPSADIEILVHELQVHQIELEMQNDELRKSEQQLAESQARYSDLYEFSPVGYFTCDSRGKILEINLTAVLMLGVERTKLLYKHFQRFVVREDVDTFHLHVQGIFQSGKPQTCEVRVNNIRNGMQFHARLESTLRKSAAGPQCRTVIIDVTELKQSEEELARYRESLEELVDERTQELKRTQDQLLVNERLATLGQVAGSISHEIRNPLAAINNSAFFLKQKIKVDDPKIVQNLDRIQRGVTKCTAIVQSLLDLGRMKEPEFRPLDIRSIVSESLEVDKVPEAITIVSNLPEQPIMVVADREQLHMAFRNIVDNALSAIDGNGQLSVIVDSSDNHQAEIRFEDTGTGIPPEFLEKIFEPLFTTKAKGIGFGLSITKLIIDKHRGSIEAVSEVGKGTKIIVHLPLEPMEQGRDAEM